MRRRRATGRGLTIAQSSRNWEFPGFVTVAVGAFADPGVPPPTVSVYEERPRPWALAVAELPMEREV